MDDSSAIAQSRIPRMSRPMLAALPFKTSGQPAWMGTAFAGDILDETVRRARLQALSRHTTFRDGHSITTLAAMGAKAILSGAVSKSELSVTLTRLDQDPVTITLPFEDRQALQPTSAAVVDWLIEAIGGPLQLPTPEKPAERATRDPMQHALILEALEHLWAFTADGNTQALNIVTECTTTHPKDAVTQALRAMLLTRAYRSGWLTDRSWVASEVETALAIAYENWTSEPILYWTSAFAEAMLLRRYPIAAQLTRRSVDLQPHNSPALTWGSLFMCYELEFDEAIALARRAIRYSPEDPMRVTQGFAGALAAIHAGYDRMAVEFSDLVLEINPLMINVLRIRAAALFNLGDAPEATKIMQEILKIDPAETQALIERVNPLREWTGFARFMSALDGAGMPTGRAA